MKGVQTASSMQQKSKKCKKNKNECKYTLSVVYPEEAGGRSSSSGQGSQICQDGLKNSDNNKASIV